LNKRKAQSEERSTHFEGNAQEVPKESKGSAKNQESMQKRQQAMPQTE